MSDDTTRVRFLGAIAAQLPAHRVVEVHLFGAIRQGGTESGVAVIAVDPNEPAPESVELLAHAPPDDEQSASGDAPPHAEPPPIVAPDAADVAGAVEALLDEPVVSGDGTVHREGDASPYAAEDRPAPEPARAAPRYTVYTARYRHTLKGPDRGKWEASVTEEADAPLLTVDAVVRGVSRRSGEADETVRLSGEEFRAALPVVAPAAAGRPQPALARR
ncbi:MAG: hypothetical protein JWL60_1459 [Gemmatimonadetes bacterium]|jgi:hypothetical protein|nr:hypothetical protein [Gemmatimonadota bacterium]